MTLLSPLTSYVKSLEEESVTLEEESVTTRMREFSLHTQDSETVADALFNLRLHFRISLEQFGVGFRCFWEEFFGKVLYTPSSSTQDPF